NFNGAQISHEVVCNQEENQPATRIAKQDEADGRLGFERKGPLRLSCQPAGQIGGRKPRCVYFNNRMQTRDIGFCPLAIIVKNQPAQKGHRMTRDERFESAQQYYRICTWWKPEGTRDVVDRGM